MNVPDYTLVIGVDKKHLRQLIQVWPTFIKHKPSLLKQPMVVFYDKYEVNPTYIYEYVKHPNIRTHKWPIDNIEYEGQADSKWTNPQRYKMLAGFVHVPSMCVETDYWLKLDTDTVATGNDDWIDSKWFEGSPAIISQRWGFTKPANQMLLLDAWVKENKELLSEMDQSSPLNLTPNEGSSRLNHKRIISWCSFFNTAFTTTCSDFANRTCGWYKLPVPSQDGYVWYLAKRMNKRIVTTNMKARGFKHRNTERNIKQAISESLYA